MARSDFSFCHKFRVRYMDVDPQMVAFNSRILEYTDVVLTEFWRDRGVHLTGPNTFEAHVIKANIEYLRPMRFDDEIDGMMRVARFGSSSMLSVAEYFMRGADEICGRVEIVHVHVDLATGKPLRISDAIRKRLADAGTEIG